MPFTHEQIKQYWEKMKIENPEKYEQHLQKKREQNKQYRETHKEQIREKEKQYRETHKEQIAERARKYRESDKGKETRIRYYNKLAETNPEKYEQHMNWIKYNQLLKRYEYYLQDSQWLKVYDRNTLLQIKENFPQRYEEICKWKKYHKSVKKSKTPQDFGIIKPKPEDCGIKPKKYKFIDDE